MTDQQSDQEHDVKQCQDEENRERRSNERRKIESKGYTYISMVGWMDRREQKRRMDDDFK
jgi:hypothetical protein